MAINVVLTQIARVVIQMVGRKTVTEAIKRGIGARIKRDVMRGILKETIKDTAIDTAFDMGVESAVQYLTTTDVTLNDAIGKAIEAYLNDPLIKTGDRSLDFVINGIINAALPAKDVYRAGKLLVDKKGAIEEILKKVEIGKEKRTFDQYVEWRVKGHVASEISKEIDKAAELKKAERLKKEKSDLEREREARKKEFEADRKKKELEKQQKELEKKEKKIEKIEKEIPKKGKILGKIKKAKAFKKLKNIVKRIKKFFRPAKKTPKKMGKQAKRMRRAIPGLPANMKTPRKKSNSPYWKWVIWCPTFGNRPWRRVVTPAAMTGVEILQTLLAEASMYNDSDRYKLVTALKQWAPNRITIYGYAPGNPGRHSNADTVLTIELDEETMDMICQES